MRFEITSSAERDLESIDSRTQRERVARKIEDLRYKVEELDIEPEKVVEKRLGGNLHPILQQRAGDYRIWLIEGRNMNKGEKESLYLLAILEKDEQKSLMGSDVIPDAFL